MIKILYSTIFPIETDRNINKFFLYFIEEERESTWSFIACLFLNLLHQM